MKRLFSLVLVLTILSYAKLDILQDEIDLLHSQVSAHVDKEFAEAQNDLLEELTAAKANVCLGGRKPSSFTRAGYLKAFAKGPCAPTVFVPGITGSKLIAVIDCEKLKAQNPTTFKDCGWNTCGFFGSKPAKEYKIWIPTVGSPMSLLSPTTSSKKCLGGMLAFKVTKTQGTIKMQPSPGITVVTAGSSPATSNQSKNGQCGFRAIEDMLPIIINPASLTYFKNLKNAYKKAGYKVGLTIQALPYDYRKDQRDTDMVKFKYGRVIKKLNDITGKKVVIVAHSYGNFVTSQYLWSLSAQEKDKRIARYIAIAPPYLGAITPIRTMISMNDKYMKEFFFLKIGLTEVVFKKALYAFTGMYALFVGNTYEAHKNEPYMKAIIDRMTAEKNNVQPKKGTVMDIFPSPSAVCNEGFKDRSGKCVFGMKKFGVLGKINGELVTFNNLSSMLAKYSFHYQAGDIYKRSYESKFTTLPNLGVQVNIIFSGAIPTDYKFDYHDNPRDITKTGKVCLPDNIESQMGDGSVLTASCLTAGIKWAQDFLDKKSNAKPVTMAEICGTYKPRTSVFDSGKRVTKNAYFGIGCSCKGTRTKKVAGTKCADHASMVTDPYLVDYILQSSIDGQTGVSKYATYSDAYLKKFENECQMLNKA